MNWEEFQSKVIEFVDRQDSNKIRYKAYAMTYAENILNAIDEGYQMGFDTRSAARTQLLYVISNLEGASLKELNKLKDLASEMDIDVSEIIKEIL